VAEFVFRDANGNVVAPVSVLTNAANMLDTSVLIDGNVNTFGSGTVGYNIIFDFGATTCVSSYQMMPGPDYCSDLTEWTWAGADASFQNGGYLSWVQGSNAFTEERGVLSARIEMCPGAVGGNATATTSSPSNLPTSQPTTLPSSFPTSLPTLFPTRFPTVFPTIAPSSLPTALPTTRSPTVLPSPQPTSLPTLFPSLQPTLLPTVRPSRLPTPLPTLFPSRIPTTLPTLVPTQQPSTSPTGRMPVPISAVMADTLDRVIITFDLPTNMQRRIGLLNNCWGLEVAYDGRVDSCLSCWYTCGFTSPTVMEIRMSPYATFTRNSTVLLSFLTANIPWYVQPLTGIYGGPMVTFSALQMSMPLNPLPPDFTLIAFRQIGLCAVPARASVSPTFLTNFGYRQTYFGEWFADGVFLRNVGRLELIFLAIY
jgi:hypothetical protein